MISNEINKLIHKHVSNQKFILIIRRKSEKSRTQDSSNSISLRLWVILEFWVALGISMTPVTPVMWFCALCKSPTI